MGSLGKAFECGGNMTNSVTFVMLGAVPSRSSGLAVVLIIISFAVKLFIPLADWRPLR